jgi:selenocysteine lyase/cysteine desulfurase
MALACAGHLLGPRAPDRRMPTLAVTATGARTGPLAAALLERGVTVGAGLLCSPLAHQALGTSDDGVLRFSAGPSTTTREIDDAAEALAELLRPA